FQYTNSGNKDIDDLIKATHSNQLKFRLEWIPFEEFTNIKPIGEGGFSNIFIAKWEKGRIKWFNEKDKEFVRAGPETVALKILKNSQNINSMFLKEIIVQTRPKSPDRYVIQCYG
ncbi:6474_t:CDS:2, partial [Acaulospora colombiana]